MYGQRLFLSLLLILIYCVYFSSSFFNWKIDKYNRDIRYDEQVKKNILYTCYSNEMILISDNRVGKSIDYSDFLVDYKNIYRNKFVKYWIWIIGDYLTARDVKRIKKRNRKRGIL